MVNGKMYHAYEAHFYLASTKCFTCVFRSLRHSFLSYICTLGTVWSAFSMQSINTSGACEVQFLAQEHFDMWTHWIKPPNYSLKDSESETFYCYVKNISSSWIWWQQYSKKGWELGTSCLMSELLTLHCKVSRPHGGNPIGTYIDW